MIRITIVIDAPDHAPTGFTETGPRTIEGWLAGYIDALRARVWQDLSGVVRSTSVESIPNEPAT